MEMPTFLKLHEKDIGEVNFSSNVAGTTFIKNSDEFLRFLQKNVPVTDIRLLLFREPENEYDSNAVRVEISVKGSSKHKKIGYIPKDRAPLLSYVLMYPNKYSVNIFDIALVGGDEVRTNIGIFFNYNILNITK